MAPQNRLIDDGDHPLAANQIAWVHSVIHWFIHFSYVVPFDMKLTTLTGLNPAGDDGTPSRAVQEVVDVP